MNLSVEYKRVKAVQDALATTLECTDFAYFVAVFHEEGSTFLYRNAFAHLYQDPEHGDWGDCDHPGLWLMVFTEHQGHHIFATCDLNDYAEYVQTPIPPYDYRDRDLHAYDDSDGWEGPKPPPVVQIPTEEFETLTTEWEGLPDPPLNQLPNHEN